MGTRPEMIKLSALIPFIDKFYDHTLISTGQHFSDSMFEEIRKSLKLRKPNISLKFSQKLPKPLQLADIFTKLYQCVVKISPNLVIVQGDTYSTLLGALVAHALGIKIFHIEAGARSFDQRMPEEIIRICVDHLAFLNQAFSEISLRNLKREQLETKSILLPNSGIESIHRYRHLINKSNQYEMLAKNSILVTLHRNTNVDDYSQLTLIMEKIFQLNKKHPIMFVTHPRTVKALKKILEDFTKKSTSKNFFPFHLVGPIPYLEFLNTIKNAKMIISDSGGIVEECHYLDKKLIILRESTEYKQLLRQGKIELISATNFNNKRVAKMLTAPTTKSQKFKSQLKDYMRAIKSCFL